MYALLPLTLPRSKVEQGKFDASLGVTFGLSFEDVAGNGLRRP